MKIVNWGVLMFMLTFNVVAKDDTTFPPSPQTPTQVPCLKKAEKKKSKTRANNPVKTKVAVLQNINATAE